MISFTVYLFAYHLKKMEMSFQDVGNGLIFTLGKTWLGVSKVAFESPLIIFFAILTIIKP